MTFSQYLKILAHPVFTGLNFHMPMVVDLSHPLIMLKGENGSGKSTLLHSLHYALKGEHVDGFVYRTEVQEVDPEKVFLVRRRTAQPPQPAPPVRRPARDEGVPPDGEPRPGHALDVRESFPKLADGTVLLLDEPEMALSQSNQRRILKMLMELVDQKNFRIVTATHSPVLLEAKETYVIDLDRHVNRNVIPEDMGVEGQSTLH